MSNIQDLGFIVPGVGFGFWVYGLGLLGLRFMAPAPGSGFTVED